MSKTLVKDEMADLLRERDKLVGEIDDALARMEVSFEQWKRKYVFAVGALFIRLRTLFEKGHKGDIAFAGFCKKHWPKIDAQERSEFVLYHKGVVKKLGASSANAEELPPIRKVTNPEAYQRDQSTNTERVAYKRILDEEVRQPQHFEIPRSAKEVENELVMELAEKIISAGFRVLSVKMHPDKEGGSHQAQRRLNAAKKLLEEALMREPMFQ